MYSSRVLVIGTDEKSSSPHPISQGTGWFVARHPSSLVVTALHVVGDRRLWMHEDEAYGLDVRYFLEADGKRHPLEPIAFDADSDVALLDCKDQHDEVQPLQLAAEFSIFQHWRAEAFPAETGGGLITPGGRVQAVDEARGDRAIELYLQEGTEIDWGGMSGSAVIVEGDAVLGVITQQHNVVDHVFAATVTPIRGLLGLCEAAQGLSRVIVQGPLSADEIRGLCDASPSKLDRQAAADAVVKLALLRGRPGIERLLGAVKTRLPQADLTEISRFLTRPEHLRRIDKSSNAQIPQLRTPAQKTYLAAVRRLIIEHLEFYDGPAATRPEPLLIDLIVACDDPQTGRSRESTLSEFAAKNLARLIVTAEGGAGKTTSLLALAAEAADLALEDYSASVPIYVRLQQFGIAGASFEGLMTLIVNASAALGLDEKEMTAFWRSGDRELLFLFDGLNEVPTEHQETCIAVLKEFAQHPRHRYVFAARPGGPAEAMSREAKFLTCRLLRLEPDQIRKFMTDRGVGHLFDQLTGRLLGLATNPFMLLALTRSCAGLHQGELPSNVGRLYQEFVDRDLFGQREPARHSAYDYLRIKRPILAELADQMTLTGITQLDWNERLETDITAKLENLRKSYTRIRKVMPDHWSADDFRHELIANGVLRNTRGVIGSTESRVEFMHHSVQEYYTAIGYVDRPVELAAKVRPLIWRHLDPNRRDDPVLANPYAGPAIMASGLLADSTKFVSGLAAFNPPIAAHCIHAATNIEAETVQALVRNWIASLKASWRQRMVACVCIGAATVREPGIIRSLVDLIAEEDAKKYSGEGAQPYAVMHVARDALRQIDVGSAVEEIISRLANGDHRISLDPWDWVVSTLDRMGSTAVVNMLVDKWREAGPTTATGHLLEEILFGMRRKAVLGAREKRNDPETSDLRSRIASRENREIRTLDDARKLHLKAVESKAREIAAGMAAGRDRSPSEMIADLRDSRSTVRRVAMELLGKRGVAEAVPHLLQAAAREYDKDTLEHLGRSLAQCAGSSQAAANLLRDRINGEDKVFLFDLPLRFATDLSQDRVTESLAAAFMEQGIDLAHFHIAASDNGWRLLAGSWGWIRTSYPIRRGSTARDVYDENVRAKLVMAFRGISSDSSITELLGLLEHGQPSVREAAVDVLRKFAYERASGPIANLLGSETDSRVARAALSAINRFKTKPPPEVLVQVAVRNFVWNSDDLAEGIHNTFIKFGLGHWFQNRLTSMLADEDAAIRWVAADELVRRRLDTIRTSYMPAPTEVDENKLLVRVALNDPHPEVRIAAAKGLRWSIGDPGIDTLCGALKASSQSIQIAAATALGYLEDDRAVDALCNALETSATDVILAAAVALRRIGANGASDRAVPSLLRIGFGEEAFSTEFRESAIRALCDSHGMQAAQILPDQALKAGKAEEAVRLADIALRAIGSDRVFSYYRGIALERLGRLDEALAEFIRCDSNQDRARILSKLGKTDEAVKLAKAAAAAAPGKATLHLDTACYAYLANDLDEAIAAAKRTLHLDENMISAVLTLGLAYLAAGKDDKAWQTYEKAMLIAAKQDPAEMNSRMASACAFVPLTMTTKSSWNRRRAILGT